MEKKSVIIVEDHVEQAQYLRSLIESLHPNLAYIGMARAKEEAKQLIRTNKPDLVFLDIELPHHTEQGEPIPYAGFHLLTELSPEDLDFFFVIISGARKKAYPILACQLSSIAFLEKPIDKAQLSLAIQKFHACSQIPDFLELLCKAQIEVFRNNFSQRDNRKWLLYVNASRLLEVHTLKAISEHSTDFEKFEFLRLPLSSIIYIQSNDQWLEFYLDLNPLSASLFTPAIQKKRKELPHRSRMVIRGKIGDLDGILEAYNFVCIHSRYLLNLDFLKAFVPKSKKKQAIGSGGEVILQETQNQHRSYSPVLKVSREGAKKLRQLRKHPSARFKAGSDEET